MMDPYIRWVEAIGLFGFSRGFHTCLWQTEWCKEHCYNSVFRRMFPDRLLKRDEVDDDWWIHSSASAFTRALEQKRKPIKRFRFAIRGEVFTKRDDVYKVRDILELNPDVLFWMPTRAWQNWSMRFAIQDHLFGLPNARVMASIDPSIALEDIRSLKKTGWRTAYVGENSATKGRWKCPKTHRHLKGHCAVCKNGCFSTKRVDVHFRFHK